MENRAKWERVIFWDGTRLIDDARILTDGTRFIRGRITAPDAIRISREVIELLGIGKIEFADGFINIEIVNVKKFFSNIHKILLGSSTFTIGSTLYSWL